MVLQTSREDVLVVLDLVHDRRPSCARAQPRTRELGEVISLRGRFEVGVCLMLVMSLFPFGLSELVVGLTNVRSV